MPIREHQYVIGTDSSEGLPKGDESFGVIMDKWSRNVVATFNGQIPPDEFAIMINIASRLYNKALQAPENNNHGYAVCQELDRMNGEIYMTTRKSPDGRETTTKLGWSTDARTRPLMLDQMEEEIRKNTSELRDPDIIAQCETFIRREKDGKPEADGAFCDDGVIARAICGQVISEKPYRAKAQHSDTRRRIAYHEATHRHNGGMGYKG